MISKEERYIEQFVTGDSAAVKARQRIEVRIAKAFVKKALQEKYEITVDNGGGDEQPKTQTVDEILKMMFQTDDEYLYVHRGDSTGGVVEGWVHFVYGNDGWDVISDNTTNLEPLMLDEVRELQEWFG